MNRFLFGAGISLSLVAAAQADVTLVANGQARCVIVADAATMAPDKMPAPAKFKDAEPERQRQRLRESVKDLALYLGKMSGAKVEVVNEPNADDKRFRIRVGAGAAKAFGPVAHTAPYKQAFRYVVSPKGVGLFGESDLATSYAVYELLDRLGCRWFMPSELGEVIPLLPTITLTDTDFAGAPGTVYRGIWYADEAYRRRNRHGGLLLSAGHALEMYVSKEDRGKHPEWRATIGGKPSPHRLQWSNPGLADFLGGKLLDLHANDPQPSYSLSPDDGADWDESPQDKALDADDWDTTHQQVSVTDRLMVLANRVAAKFSAKHPDVPLGMLAYVQYTRPPVREKLHPSIVPQIAPIAYCRSHPMTDDRVPGAKDLRYMIEGWGKKAKATSMYYYAFNLAETSSPQPFLAKWAVDVPIAFRNNCRYWQPETLSTFEVNMQALYLGCRLAWDPKLKPEDVYAEIHAKFYGAAAKEMDAYWRFLDDVWVNTPEYSGCGFGHLRRWTPGRLAEARRLLNLGIASCKTPAEAKRVQLANDSFALFESFMKLRRDQAEGKFIHLAEDADAWRKKIVALGEQYKDQFCFTRVGWTPHTVAGAYFAQFYQQTYDDAARIAKNFNRLAHVREFRYLPDPEKKGESAGWMKPEFSDKAWEATDVCTETWSTLGLHDYFKSVWYRAEFHLAPTGVSNSLSTYLWLGGFDGSAKVFVNGQLVKHKGTDGKLVDEATGYCQPFSYDITSVAKPGANSVAILCTRKEFNELGTGGLLAPIMVYAEPPRKWVPSTATAVPFETAPEGEGYFSIIEGKNGKLYVGTHANGVNAWLVEFDPKTKAMKVVVDCHKAIGKDIKGFGAQAKIHTRNNVGASGKIYFGTKQGYPDKNEKREDYPGGYPMTYDPATGETKVYDIPVKHHGINSITPDESRGIAYISTCSDGRPGPGENSIFLILDLKTGKYRELIDTKHVYGFIVLDHLGRAYHPLNGGDIARYDPKTDKLERLKQTIDGAAPPASFHFADQPSGHPINWDVSPDGKTLYSVAMSTNKLFAYDLTAAGDTIPGKDLGALVPTATETDCRAMCVGPTGKVWISVTQSSKLGISLHHLVSYTPGEKHPRDHGPVSIANPDYVKFTDAAGKPRPFHGGVFKTTDGITTSRHVTLGVCQSKAGGVYVLMLQPYTVLEIAPDAAR